MAAMLAQRGFSAEQMILEGDFGFKDLFSGHLGGEAINICNNGMSELYINIAVANRTAEILLIRGYQVEILEGTPEAVRDFSADAFISLHIDMCSVDYSGYKVARWKGLPGKGTDGSGDASDRLVEALWLVYGEMTRLPRDTSIGHYPPCYFLEYYALNPVELGPNCTGSRIHRGISNTTPGAILEMGFLSGDYDFVTSTDGQHKMAVGIANAIDYFFGEGH